MTGFLKAIQILHELYREKGFPMLVYQYEHYEQYEPFCFEFKWRIQRYGWKTNLRNHQTFSRLFGI